jgi:HTH-type transcriptional repressor of NAD biosynthesis genes
MIKAFVFGKFYPFHKGHEAMINFALKIYQLMNIFTISIEQRYISI